MDIYLWKPEEYQRLYNCSFYKIEEIPLEKRQHIFLGICFILLFFLFEFLYIPCLLAIRKHLEHSCFKIMFYMGINDILCLFICGLLTGILGIYGAVFCSFPNLIYISGVVGRVFWFNETICAIMLAINRCLEISMPSLTQSLFEGAKTWLWLGIPLVYGLLCGLPLGKPILFSGILFSWFYNPHVGYADDFSAIYQNPMDTVNNATLISLLPTSYLIFLIILACRYCTVSGGTNNVFRSQKKIFIQVLLISSIHMTTVFIIFYMQLIHINEYIIYIGTFGWLFVHGLKPVIYLSLNSTIRQDVSKMICGFRQNQIFVNSAGGLTNGPKITRNNNATMAINRGATGVGTL